MVDLVVVEDDDRLRSVLVRALGEEGYAVASAASGKELLAWMDDGSVPRAFVLDIGLPDSDGRDLCQAIRARGIVSPVLFLTAREGLHDKLAGFDAGGDDYIVKPFALSELLARIQVMIRRASVPDAELREQRGLTLDPTELSVRHGDAHQRLSPTEFRLLARLLADAGTTVHRRDLKRAGWPRGAVVSDDTLNTLIARLRTKLRALPEAPSIGTVPHVGYRIG